MERHELKTPRPKAAANRRKLTDIFIRSVAAPAKTRLWWDIGQGGLALQVTPKGTKSFKVVYQHEGKLRWFHVDRYPAVGLAEARMIARKIRAKAALGEDPHGDKVAARIEARQGDSLENVSRQYVNQWARRNNKSWRQAHGLMQRYVLPSLGKRKVKNIGRRDIRAIFDKLTFEQNSPILANQVLAAVSKILSWAVKRDIAATNMARDIDRNPTKSVERFLSDKELKLVWPAFEQLGFNKTMALRLILITAQRPGEICAMRWEDIDLGKGVWTLPGNPDKGWPGTKNGRTHEVPLTVPALEILAELEPQESGPVFPHRIPSVLSVWKALGIDRFRPHDLRATAATGMDALGISKEYISRVLNHVEGGVTASYIRHDAMEQKRRALDAWGLRLMAIVEGQEPPSKVVQIRAG